MKKMSTVGWIAFVLVIIGALNWGLVGVFGWNLVDAIFGAGSVISRIIYVLVGLSAIEMLAEGMMMKKGKMGMMENKPMNGGMGGMKM